MKNKKTNVGSFAQAKNAEGFFSTILQAKICSILAITALVAVIGFSMVSCEDDADGNGDGNAIEGNTITTGEEVVYDSSIKNVTEAKKVTDFSYMEDYDFSNGFEINGIKPLSYYLDGSPSVTISGGKVTIILGTPKSSFLEEFGYLREGITVTPSDTKSFARTYFFSSDYKYNLCCMKDDENYAFLIYVDKDVTINGTGTDEVATYKNVSLKKGWNYMSVNKKIETVNYNTYTYTSSTTMPSGFKWTVFENENYIDGGTLTINNLPRDSFLVYVLKSGTNVSTSSAIENAMEMDTNMEAFGLILSGGNSCVLIDQKSKGWKGTGTFPVVLTSYDGYNFTEYKSANITFTDGYATINYSVFSDVTP